MRRCECPSLRQPFQQTAQGFILTQGAAGDWAVTTCHMAHLPHSPCVSSLLSFQLPCSSSTRQWVLDTTRTVPIVLLQQHSLTKSVYILYMCISGDLVHRIDMHLPLKIQIKSSNFHGQPSSLNSHLFPPVWPQT